MRLSSIRRLAMPAALLLTLLACTPRYDWREVQGGDPSFTVLMPGKPATYARPVELGAVRVTMTMTAAKVDNHLFAVGAARVPRPEDAAGALEAMKSALVKNIGGKITVEKSSGAMLEIEAVGPPSPGSAGEPRLLAARFVAEGDRIYQAVATGGEKSLPRDAVDTFLTSFKPA